MNAHTNIITGDYRHFGRMIDDTATVAFTDKASVSLIGRLCNPPASWNETPEARELLASFVDRRPRIEGRTTTYAITRDEWAEYVGTRVDRLREIYDMAGDVALQHGHDTGDYVPFRDWCDLNVDKAIDAVLAGGTL